MQWSRQRLIEVANRSSPQRAFHQVTTQQVHLPFHLSAEGTQEVLRVHGSGGPSLNGISACGEVEGNGYGTGTVQRGPGTLFAEVLEKDVAAERITDGANAFCVGDPAQDPAQIVGISRVVRSCETVRFAAARAEVQGDPPDPPLGQFAKREPDIGPPRRTLESVEDDRYMTGRVVRLHNVQIEEVTIGGFPSLALDDEWGGGRFRTGTQQLPTYGLAGGAAQGSRRLVGCGFEHARKIHETTE